MKFIAPTVLAKGYTCPHCSAFAEQTWWGISWEGGKYASASSGSIKGGFCQHCEQRTLWIGDKMIFPEGGSAPPPNAEMPNVVLNLYREASAITSSSPRGSAALLRLAVQVLCKELGESGKNINSDIASLVKKGLPEIVQQSLDIVRVTGNNAVHPGQIDVDDPAVVARLFDLLNIIVEYMIAMPKRVSGIYTSLSSSTRNEIEKRDGLK